MPFVNGVAKSEDTGATSIVATSQNHTAGNSIIVAVGNYTSGTPRSVSSLVDTAGNTFTKRGPSYNGDANSVYEFWSVDNCLGNASNIVTANFGGAAHFTTIQVIQYSGLLTAGSYDAASTGKIPSSGTTQTTNAVTTTAANDLVLGFFSAWSFAFTLSGSGGSVIRVDEGSNSNTGIAEIIATTAGAYTVTIGTSGTTQYQCVALAFKIATGGAAGAGARISDMSKQPMIRGPM